jgi:isoleucyl-tRNA synthetase
MISDGKKMSKSLKNYPDPNKILDQYGADATRFVPCFVYLFHAALANL